MKNVNFMIIYLTRTKLQFERQTAKDNLQHLLGTTFRAAAGIFIDKPLIGSRFKKTYRYFCPIKQNKNRKTIN